MTKASLECVICEKLFAVGDIILEVECDEQEADIRFFAHKSCAPEPGEELLGSSADEVKIGELKPYTDA